MLMEAMVVLLAGYQICIITVTNVAFCVRCYICNISWLFCYQLRINGASIFAAYQFFGSSYYC